MSTEHMTETAKVKALEESGKSTLVQEFIDWLLEDQNLMLIKCDRLSEIPEHCQRHLFGNRDRRNPEQLMADFFGIDLDKRRREADAALAEFLKSQP